MIMIGQFVHGHLPAGHGKACGVVLHGAPETIGISQKILSEIVAVFLHSCQKPGHRLHKGIVIHHRIPLIALEPVTGIAVMLCQHDSIGIGLLHGFAEILPEVMIELLAVTQICCHIQSPAVCIVRRRYPFFCNPEYIFVKLLGAFIIELGQGIMSPPAVIGTVVGPSVLIPEIKIGAIRTVCTDISPLLLSGSIFINAFSVHPFIEGTAVIEHAVQDHTHSPAMGFLHHFDK